MPRPARLAFPALSLTLAACAQTAEAPPGSGGAPASVESNACGASARQDLVGQRVDVLNSADLPEGFRVLFPGMSATSDFREDRLNISVGTSDAITRVFCG